MTTLVCIATGQPLANLIPVLLFKPEQVIVLASTSFKNKAKAFRDLLRDLGATASVRMVDGCPDTKINEIMQFVEQKVIQLLPEESCYINLTGGTKLHSFAVYECLKHRSDRMFYVDTTNRLIEYYPTSSQVESNEPLPPVLDIELTLKGMGKQRIKAESDTEQWRSKVNGRADLSGWIAEHVSSLTNILGSFNAVVDKQYAGGRKNILNLVNTEIYTFPKGLEVELLEKAHDLHLIRWQGGKSIQFENYEQSRYLTGGGGWRNIFGILPKP